MALVAGIDEAGFGPILGPLVVSASVFEVPDPQAGGCLWKLLAPSVGRKNRRGFTGLAIGDSKKLYSPSTGLKTLERGVLGTLSLLDRPMESLRVLLGWLCPAALAEMDAYPWYASQDLPLPTCGMLADIRLRANGLRAAMEEKGVRLAGFRSEVVLEGRYNRLVSATDNKATTLLDQSCRLIDAVWQHCRPGRRGHVFVDRQGGRSHYRPALQRMFEGCQLKVLVEEPGESGYRVSEGGREIEVRFQQGGEDRQLPVALASMMSKYVRELFMQLFNRYWAGHVADLKPTAGYYEDGLRFLSEIADARRRLGTPEELLVRTR